MASAKISEILHEMRAMLSSGVHTDVAWGRRNGNTHHPKDWTASAPPTSVSLQGALLYVAKKGFISLLNDPDHIRIMRCFEQNNPRGAWNANRVPRDLTVDQIFETLRLVERELCGK